jgi:uncharacterized protein involved in outer membrane biogenesis
MFAELPATISKYVPPRRWLLRIAVGLGVIAGLIVLSWLAVPPLVRGQVETRLTAALDRKTTLERVDFNPFKLRLALHKLAVAGLVSVDEVDADISSASLWHRAPVLDALRLVRPSVTLSRDAAGRYNVQDLVDGASSRPDGPTPGFSLNNIEIEDGAVAFDDGMTGSKHRIDKLAIGVPFLSTLPYETDITVRPHLAGTFNGSHFSLTGSAVPFAQHREAAIDVDLDALPLPAYVAYLPRKPRVDLASGALTTRIKVVFVEGAPGGRKLEIRGDAQVDDLAVKRRDGSPLLSAGRLAVSLDRIDVFGRDVTVKSVDIERPEVDLRRLSSGALELAQPMLEGAAPRNGKPWAVAIGNASLTNGTFSLADDGSAFRSRLVDVAIDARNVTTKPGDKAHVTVSFVTDDRVASFKGEADVEPLVPAAAGSFELAKFSLSLLFPYYKDVLAVDVQKGSLDLAGRFALQPDGNVRLTEGNATIGNLALAYPGARQPLATLPTVAAGGVEVDVDARRVSIATLATRDASIRLARERDGTLDVARVMKTSATTGTANDEATWTLAIAKFAVERASIDAEDRVPDPAVKLAVRDLNVEGTSFSNARAAKSAVALRARVGKSGRVTWKGALATNPVFLSGRIDAAGLDLVSVRPYVESQANLTITGGAVSATGNFAFDGARNATWKGSVVVTDFSALDKPTSSDLLRWKRLAIDDMDVAVEPWRVSVARIGIEDYYARAIVYPDGTLNLTRLMTTQAASTEAERPREALPITLGRIELARGNINLSDFFVKPNYSANLTDVSGTITTMSAEQAGDVAISARVDHSAPVEVSGRIHPFAKELTLDIAAKARDIDLPPLTPYSVKYAGYGIEKGKLTFDVHYRLDNRKLVAENRLVLDQLTFNSQRVDSPTATKLPVLLAVALLKDTRGVIDINLPVSGSLDDPQFSVGGLIIRVIVNLIAKAATAPFALLSAAFGHGEELSTLTFADGSATLDEEAGKRVETLAKALADRPGLKLDIAGRADPQSDREALRHATVDTAIKRQKMKSLAAQGEAPPSLDAVQIEGTERTRWLTAAYKESGIKDRPRNVIGMLKDVPPEEMEAMLLASASVDDDALRQLANARAQAVKDALVSRNVAAERVFLIAPKLTTEASPSRVDLALR